MPLAEGGGAADAPGKGATAGSAEPPLLFAPEPGPLATVRIAPRQARRTPGRGCRLTAVPRDADGTQVIDGLAWEWRNVAGDATLEPDGNQCMVTSALLGLVTVEAVARQGSIEAADRVDVKFLEQADGDGAGGRGLPSYRLEAEHGQPWRSRYDARANEIVINSAHRDFLASRSSAGRHRRYIGKLYAKEVVLTNFPHESPAAVMERLIEVTLRTEDAL
jgi:hypothetical protein